MPLVKILSDETDRQVRDAAISIRLFFQAVTVAVENFNKVSVALTDGHDVVIKLKRTEK